MDSPRLLSLWVSLPPAAWTEALVTVLRGLGLRGLIDLSGLSPAEARAKAAGAPSGLACVLDAPLEGAAGSQVFSSAWEAGGVPPAGEGWVEVTRASSLALLAARGVRGVLLCGVEAGGREPLLSLLAEARRLGFAERIARGAVSPATLPALAAAGATGALAETCLWAAPELSSGWPRAGRPDIYLARPSASRYGTARGILRALVEAGAATEPPALPREAAEGAWVVSLEELSGRAARGDKLLAVACAEAGDPSAPSALALWPRVVEWATGRAALGQVVPRLVFAAGPEDGLQRAQNALLAPLARLGLASLSGAATEASALPSSQTSVPLLPQDTAAPSTRRAAPAGHERPSAQPPAGSPAMKSETERQGPEPIAIVGIGARLPGGNSTDAFWRFVTERGDAIREVPRGRWDPTLYFDADPKAPDRTYTKIGGWITDFEFDRKAYRVPPSVVPQLDEAQRLGLAAAEEALRDAGLLDKDWDRERCAVILGNSMGGELHDTHTRRLRVPEFVEVLRMVDGFARLPQGTREEILRAFEARAKEGLPPITEDTMPGELSNVIAGRIANVFDLGGPNFTCDAACASAAAAFDAAARGLRAHEYDVVLTGGVDRQMGPDTFIKFCKIGALSPRGSFPFDERADGFVMGEGAALFVLKRLSDAQRDGDRVYAIFLGAGGSSDGRGKGITAPNPAGQLRAVQRAYAFTQIDPATIDLIEAHGTATKVGDGVEVGVLSQVFRKEERRRPVALGSVKSQIGHLKSAAAAAAIVKVAKAMYHKTLPPQIRYETPSPALEIERTGLRVQTQAEPWEATGPRRAAVSAFGFGGVNFHLLFEEAPEPGSARRALSGASRPAPRTEAPAKLLSAPEGRTPGAEKTTMTQPEPSHANPATPDWSPLGGVSLFGAATREALVARLRGALASGADPGDGAAAAGAPYRLALAYETSQERAELLSKAAEALEANRSLALLEQKGAYYREGQRQGKLAFLFPGQGSQHLWMGEALRARAAAFDSTWHEADAIAAEMMGGPLSHKVFVAKGQAPEAEEKAFKALSSTDVAQPAIFTSDVAYWRLLLAHGVYPDAVAGHSLGEYAAGVAAGVASFDAGFRAVCVRGREMSAVKSEDRGKMASVSANLATVEEVLAEVTGYVIAANKNCPSQTVIAGASKAVEEAVQRFTERRIACVMLPVSHAFHSQIVAPATEALRRFLDTLPLHPPALPLVANVTADYYPSGPTAGEAADQIRDLLGRQVAASVEFSASVERLYHDGATLFLEVGPRKALSGFLGSILGAKPHRAYHVNDPKRGELPSLRRALAALAAEGFGGAVEAPSQEKLARGLALIAPKAPAPAPGKASAAPAPTAPAPQPAPAGGQAVTLPTPVVSGISVGLPGGERVFDERNFDSILAGENRIHRVDEAARRRIVEKNIVRVVKDATKGGGDFQTVSSVDEVIQLAGRAGALDIAREFGVEAQFVAALDRTSQLALGAGLQALRDAGVPLARAYRTTTKGAKIGTGWRLPDELADETGVIFACAFPGYNRMIEHLGRHADDRQRRAMIDAYRALETELQDPAARAQIAQKRAALEAQAPAVFERRFLFEVLSMGHSQFAQWVGARGPNTQVNAACASTTQAISIAEDWIRLGRCRRVLVLGADDVTSETFFEWVGAGFLAAGAATTETEVTRAALPFDRRRHGMIIGMGAVALVIEHPSAMADRGMRPVAEVLGTRIANSAFHGSRLEPDHIAREVEALVAEVEQRHGLRRQDIARQCLFMSHETYTPARGGSAAAEIMALRRAFGEDASSVVIANTKGFTGHAMGAGIEDAVVLKALQRQHIPPIANLREPDPDLGDLTLSKGGHYDVHFALRLAAGFGSQLALTLYRRSGGEDRLVQPARYTAWLSRISGIANPATTVVDGTLRVVEAEAAPTVAPAPAALPAPAPVAVVKASVSREEVKTKLYQIVAEKTGYGIGELEEGFALEADLGIDTVKQAEIISSVRDAYQLPRDDSFKLSDYPTLTALIDYLSNRLAGVLSSASLPTSGTVVTARVESTPAPQGASYTKDDPRGGLSLPFVGRRVGLRDLPPARRGGSAAGDWVALASSAGDPDAAALGRALAPLGVRLQVLGVPSTGWDEAALVSQLQALGIARAVGVLNLLGLASADESSWAGALYPRARGAFHVARALELALGGAPRPGFRWVTLSALGGGLGIEHAEGALPVAMAQVGIQRALAREWSGLAARWIDAEPSALGEVLARELEAEGTHAAVGVRGGRRVTLGLGAEDLPAARQGLVRGEVVLITGGARGVTAEIAKELAKQGAAVVLVGRTALSPEVEAAPDTIDVAKRREEARAKLQAEGRRVTPAALDAEVAPLRTQIEIAKTLQALRVYGPARYFAADARDEAALARVVEETRRALGPIRGVIHGAGVEESRLLAQKDGAAFDRVFLGKAQGGLALWRLVAQDRPRFFLGMGSVAGFFGNPGQVDYAAANAALAGLCAHLSAHTETRAASLDWTAWDEVGMAARGGMKRLLSDRGVDLLPVAQGVAFAWSAIEAKLTGEWVIAGRLGDFEPSPGDEPGTAPSSSTPAPAPASAAPVTQAAPGQWNDRAPLFDRVLEYHEGQRATLLRGLRPEEDRFLSDHARENTPLLPGVVGLELMAQAAGLVASGQVLQEALAVEFLRPVKAFAGRAVEVLVSASRAEDGTVRASLRTKREAVGGKILETEHFAATFRFGAEQARAARQPIDLGAVLGAGPAREAIYQRYFHGPSFQVIAELHALGPDGAAGRFAPPEVEVPTRHTDPLPRELAFQVAGLHAMAAFGVEALPAGIGCVKRFAPVGVGAKCSARARFLGRDERGQLRYQAEIVAEDGRLLEVMEGLRLVPAGQLAEEQRFSLPAQPPLDVITVGTGPVGAVLLSSPELLIEGWLAPSERARFAGLVLERRRIEWMSGRLAAKRLVRRYLSRRFGVELPPLELVIENETGGMPRCVACHTRYGLPEGAIPGISITHSGEVAAAALTEGGRPGIDVERIEPRDASFREHCFTPREAALAAGEREASLLTCLFSVKEAVSKTLGTGLTIDLREIEVTQLQNDGVAEVVLHGQAASHLAQLGGGRVEASVETKGAYAYAYARLLPA